jgi:hypothetical protein
MADNQKIVRSLYSILEDALFLGDRLSSSEFSLLMQPGQFLSTNLRELDSSEDMAIQAELTNDAIDTSFLYLPLTGTVSQKYFETLEFAALPKRNLSSAEIKEITDIRSWADQYQSLYETYRDRYFDALDAYETEACSQNPNGSRLRRLAQKRDDALQAWETFGRKQDWQIKQARLNYLLSGNPEVMWNDFKKRMSAHLKTAPRRGDYYQTFLIPSVAEWNSASTSWGRFEKEINESSNYNYSKSTSWSAGGGGAWGLWSARAGGSGSSTYKREIADTSIIIVKFDYLRVRIHRPWLIDDVFSHRFWTWKKGSGMGPYLSDGGNISIDPPVRPRGNLPFLSKSLIVAKNVELTANFSHRDATFIQTQLNASASGGWGPFSFSGSYSESTSEQTIKASFDGTSLKIAQPQIIGLSGKLLPCSPNPIKNLPWQGDHEFPEDMLIGPALEKMQIAECEDYLLMTEQDMYNTLRQKISAYREAEDRQMRSNAEQVSRELREEYVRALKKV